MTSASFFKIKLKYFLDTLIQKIYFLIIKMYNFRGELSDISAEKEALCVTREQRGMQCLCSSTYIRQLTLKTIYLYHKNCHLKDQSIPEM